MCVYDPIGANGPLFQSFGYFKTEAIAWGVALPLLACWALSPLAIGPVSTPRTLFHIVPRADWERALDEAAVRALLAGRRGAAFEFSTLATIAPDRIQLTGQGSVERRALVLHRPRDVQRRDAGAHEQAPQRARRGARRRGPLPRRGDRRPAQPCSASA